jgi:hypothetical protein
MYSIPKLPDPLAREIYAALCTSLPSPASATPEGRASRDERAMTAVAHYLPENAAEAELAAQIVAADFHAKDALRAAAAALAVEDAPEARRCRAQAASMMRQMHAGVRTLQRMQAEREKAETAMRPAAMQRAGYWFHSGSRYINMLVGYNRYVPGSAHGYGKFWGPHHQPQYGGCIAAARAGGRTCRSSAGRRSQISARTSTLSAS